MKKCPVCGSRKFKGNRRVGWYCPRCHYKNIPENLRKSLEGHHKADNGPVTIEQGISPYITMNSPLFQEIHDLHNNGWKFKKISGIVDKDPTPGFKGKTKWLTHNGHRVQVTKNWLMIYRKGRNKVPLSDLADRENEILGEFTRTAEEIAERHGLVIDKRPVAMGNRPEIKTPFLSGVNFNEKGIQAVYPVPSPVEMKGPDAVKNSYNLTEVLANLTDLTRLEIHNKQLHQAVLEDMRDALSEIKVNVSRPVGLSSKIKNVLGLWLAKIKPKTTSKT